MQVSPGRQQRLQLHTVSPAAQRLTQVPRMHTWPQGQPPGHEAGAHWYRRGLDIGTSLQVDPAVQAPGQKPPQPSAAPHIVPVGHAGTQRQVRVVASHTRPVGHIVPKPQLPVPQGCAMAVPQATVPTGGAEVQVRTHAQVPAWQVCGDVHARPQVPQLLLSVAVVTQRPAQSVWPVGHTQRPPEQVVPAGQRLPQVPQLAASVETLMHRSTQ